jgi:hypothetical protein
MTKPVNRPHKKPGFAPKMPPANAAARIQTLAATGHSVVGIARGLNTSREVLARWMKGNPALAEAMARGRASEELALHNVLYRAATKRGNIIAAIYLTKARHGWIDRPVLAVKDDDGDPPAPIAVTVDFKDSARKPPRKR